MGETVRLAIAGALGRMGQTVARVAGERAGVEVAARFDRVAGDGLVTRDDALALSDVVIDFTSGAASADLARAAAARGGPALVIGSTGFTAEQESAVVDAAGRVAIVKAGNFSLGVNLLIGLAAQAARALPAGAFDIEVFEAHHRRKVDAPSGTALMLGEAAARGRGVRLDEAAVRVRDGITGPRSEGSIGFSVMRGGGVIGEHSVIFAAEDEIITLSHSARDRSLFARGAVEAARWVAGKPPGLYDMQDVLNLR
jgi:4-hydroxy-tetrahydrodipicolinate reductase